jgi:hypothetical protein
VSVASLVKELFAPRLGSRKWGAQLDLDGAKRDTGVQPLADELVNAVSSTGGVTDVYEPVKIRWHGAGPLFQIEGTSENGTAIQFGKMVDGLLKAMTLGAGGDSDGLVANNVIPTPWSKLSPEEIQEILNRGRSLWFKDPSLTGTNVGEDGNGAAGQGNRNYGTWQMDAAEFSQLVMQILEALIGGCCANGEGAAGASCVRSLAMHGWAAVSGWDQGARQTLSHEEDDPCISWIDAPTACSLLADVPNYDAGKTQVLGHINGVCTMIDLGDCPP